MNAITDRGAVEAVIKRDRQASLRLFGRVFAAIAGPPAGWLIYLYSTRPGHLQSSLWIVPLIGMISLYVFYRYRPWSDGIAYTITSRGLVDGIGGWDWIGWEEMTGAELRSTYLGPQFIELGLRHPEAVLARVPSSRRWFMNARPQLPTATIEGGGERLLGYIRQRLQQKPAAISSPSNPVAAQSHSPAPSAHAWRCYRCGASNEPNAQQCKACGFSAPRAAPPPLPPAAPTYPWVCPKCGLYNKDYVTAVCASCGCPAYSAQTGDPEEVNQDSDPRYPREDSLFALMCSIAAAFAGIAIAWTVFQRGHPFAAIAFLLAGCGLVPWLEYTLLHGDKAPYARLILYVFIALAALAGGRILGSL